NVTAARVARMMELGPATVTRVVDRLESRGLVVRERRLDDRRKIRLALTQSGEDLATRQVDLLDRVLRERIEELGPGLEDAVLDALEQLTRILNTISSPS
ncbi:MAG: MarR family transcriptional regulator, partial [Myxococcales bacterium]|nr:MarR family transcriptional regulator [Myxococcales bacterium]